MGKCLGIMNKQQLGDCFYFYDHRLIYQNVGPVSHSYLEAVVHEGKWNLDEYTKTPITKLLHKAGFIGTLQQAGSQYRVHPHSSANYLSSQHIDFVSYLSV